MLVLLVADAGEIILGPEPLRRLSELGITNVSLVRNETTVGIVLEGWAFDVERSSDDVASIVSDGRPVAALLPMMQAAVVPTIRKGAQA